jgi:hypothetical protein
LRLVDDEEEERAAAARLAAAVRADLLAALRTAGFPAADFLVEAFFATGFFVVGFSVAAFPVATSFAADLRGDAFPELALRGPDDTERATLRSPGLPRHAPRARPK